MIVFFGFFEDKYREGQMSGVGESVILNGVVDDERSLGRVVPLFDVPTPQSHSESSLGRSSVRSLPR